MLVEIQYLSSFVKLDSRGLALVLAACEKLTRGPTTIDELWPGSGDPYQLKTLLKYQLAFNAARKEFAVLKDAAHALDALRAALNAKLATIERAVVPAMRHYGMHAIPNEVFLRIFRYAYEVPYESNAFTMLNSDSAHAIDRYANGKLRRLALVNRRFRDLIYSMPFLWADICWERGWSQSRAQKSIHAINGIELDVQMLHQYEMKDVQKLRQYSHKWRSLTLEHTRFLAIYPGWGTLRNLQRIYFDNAHIGKKHSEIPFFDMLQPIRLPSLKELHISLSKPMAYIYNIPLVIISQLTILTLRGMVLKSVRELNALMALIAAGTELRRLALGFDVDTTEDADLTYSTSTFHEGSPELPSLKFLSLHSSFRGTLESREILVQAMISGMHTISMPLLKSVLLGLDGGSTSFLQGILSNNSQFSRVQELDLRLSRGEWRRSHGMIFAAFSQLEALSLSFAASWQFHTSTIVSDRLPGVPEIAKLRNFALKDDYGGEKQLVLDIFAQEVINLESMVIKGYCYSAKVWTDFCNSRLRKAMHVQFL